MIHINSAGEEYYKICLSNTKRSWQFVVILCLFYLLIFSMIVGFNFYLLIFSPLLILFIYGHLKSVEISKKAIKTLVKGINSTHDGVLVFQLFSENANDNKLLKITEQDVKKMERGDQFIKDKDCLLIHLYDENQLLICREFFNVTVFESIKIRFANKSVFSTLNNQPK